MVPGGQALVTLLVSLTSPPTDHWWFMTTLSDTDTDTVTDSETARAQAITVTVSTHAVLTGILQANHNGTPGYSLRYSKPITD